MPAGQRSSRRPGAHGELTGILMIRAYHLARGDIERDEVIVPDSSHGTNPATASMAGFRTVTVPSAPDGGVDLDALRAALGPRTAAVMLTNPSTLGLFERRIDELLDAVHAAGALAYMDGANMNAILGRFRPGAAGLRRHALQPAQDVLDAARRRRAGRRPGRGQRASRAVPARAARRRASRDGTFRLERPGERPTSIGRVRAYQGSVGVLVRAYAYIRAHGGDGPAPGQRGCRARRELPAGTRGRRLRPALRRALQARVRGSAPATCAASTGSARSTSPSA